MKVLAIILLVVAVALFIDAWWTGSRATSDGDYTFMLPAISGVAMLVLVAIALAIHFIFHI